MSVYVIFISCFPSYGLRTTWCLFVGASWWCSICSTSFLAAKLH